MSIKTRSLLIVGLPLMLQACATYQRSEAVTTQMARTQAVIEQADRSGVAVNALPELQSAKDKYAQARTALERESASGDREALQLARQAEVDAQYATAKAQSDSQQAAARDAQKSVEELRRETERKLPTHTTSP